LAATITASVSCAPDQRPISSSSAVLQAFCRASIPGTPAYQRSDCGFGLLAHSAEGEMGSHPALGVNDDAELEPISWLSLLRDGHLSHAGRSSTSATRLPTHEDS
jgi:hypothetical protein